MPTFAWCALPHFDVAANIFDYQLSMHAGGFTEADFVDYYMELADGCMVALDNTTESRTCMISTFAFETLLGTEGLWECPTCHIMPTYKMPKCNQCWVRYCSEACQKKDWKGHKEMCKALTQLREARFKTSRKLDRYRNLIRQRSRTGKGFQIVSAAIGAASFEDAPFLLCQGDDDGVHGQEQVLVLTWGGAAPKQMF